MSIKHSVKLANPFIKTTLYAPVTILKGIGIDSLIFLSDYYNYRREMKITILTVLVLLISLPHKSLGSSVTICDFDQRDPFFSQSPARAKLAVSSERFLSRDLNGGQVVNQLEIAHSETTNCYVNLAQTFDIENPPKAQTTRFSEKRISPDPDLTFSLTCAPKGMGKRTLFCTVGLQKDGKFSQQTVKILGCKKSCRLHEKEIFFSEFDSPFYLYYWTFWNYEGGEEQFLSRVGDSPDTLSFQTKDLVGETAPPVLPSTTLKAQKVSNDSPSSISSAEDEGFAIPKDIDKLRVSETNVLTQPPYTTQALKFSWTPCAMGMCYENYGNNRGRNEGVGGVGSKGCKKVFGCSGASTCSLGVCPGDFVQMEKNKYNFDSCVTSSSCYSNCGAGPGVCKRNNHFARLSSKDFSKWMSHVQEKPLNSLFLVGAHHTLARLGTVNFRLMVETQGINNILDKLNDFFDKIGRFKILINSSFRNIFKFATEQLLPAYASTQESNTADLLKHGVRLLDFRPYYYNGSRAKHGLYDYHGGQGPAMEPELMAIKTFLTANPSETVYLIIQNILVNGCNDCAKDAHDKVIEALESTFGTCENGYVVCDFDFNRPVKYFAGKVILFSDEPKLKSQKYIAPGHYGSGPCDISTKMCGRYYNKNNLNEIVTAIKEDTDSLSKVQNSDGMLRLFQFQLTPNQDDYIGAVTQRYTARWQDKANRHGCQSIACLARVANVETFIKSGLRTKVSVGNILFLDFADYDIIQQAIDLNVSNDVE